MIQKRRVSLNRVELDELDERIIISGIDEAAGKDNISATSVMYGPGQRITNMRRDTLDVSVKFKMAIKNKDMRARAELLELINEWAAGGGWLRVGHRPGRRLRVVLAQAPGGGDLFSWTNEYTIVFRAYSMPFWEGSETKVERTSAIKTGSLALQVPGNTDTRVSVTITNGSGKQIDSIDVSVVDANNKGNTMQFRGLAMKSTDTLSIEYEYTEKLYVLKCTMGGHGVMAARTPESADEFVVNPGAYTVKWDAERAVKVSATVRGRYL